MNHRQAPCVAITGASGLIGRRLCEFFADRGWPVRGLVRQPTKQGSLSGVEWFQCDLPDGIDPAGLDGADVLIHAAYTTRYQQLDEARRVNEEGSGKLFELARRRGVRQIVFLSSFSSRPDALSYYGRSKYAVELLLARNRDLALRAGLVLSPDGGLFCRIVSMLERARCVPLIGGRQIVQTVHIDDLCLACQRTIERQMTGLVHVAEVQGLAFRDLLRLVLTHLRRRCLLVPVPFAPMFAALRVAERLGVRLGVTSENLLGMKALRHITVEDDLQSLGVRPRAASESIATLVRELAGNGRRPPSDLARDPGEPIADFVRGRHVVTNHVV